MPRKDLEIDLLRAFVAVAEGGGFTAAAEVISRSQSAVSQKILRLEEALGTRVFERTSRSLSLTPAGERLLLATRRMLVQYDGFLQEITTPPSIRLLRLGISENLVPTQLPRLLSRFTALHPDIELELSTALSHELLAQHDDGLLDVVIAMRRHGSGKGLVIWREPLVWIAARDHRIAQDAPVRLVTMRPPCGYRGIMIETLASVRREWVFACTASNLPAAQAAVTGGLGITALGASFLQEGMRVVDPSEGLPPLPSTEVVVIADNPDLNHLTQPLIALLTEGLMARGTLA